MECSFRTSKISGYGVVLENILPHTLAYKEMNLVNKLNTDAGLSKLFLWCRNITANEAVAKILSHLSFEKLDVAKQYIEFCTNKIPFAEHLTLPAYLMAIEEIMLLNDSNLKEKAQILDACLFELMSKKINQIYLSFSYVTDLVIKMGLKSECFHKQIRESSSLIKFIKKWHKSNSLPSGLNVIGIIIIYNSYIGAGVLKRIFMRTLNLQQKVHL